MKHSLGPARVADDEGIGLIEIVVAMFVVALIALAMLPLFVQGIRQSDDSATLATANQLVRDQLSLVTGQSAPALCGTVRALTSVSVPAPGGGALTDSRGVPLTLSRSAGACPAHYPGTVSLNVAIVRTDTNKTLVKANTLVYVTGS